MRRLAALLGALTLVLAACGKYGPPVRTQPARPAEPAPATAPAFPDEPGNADEERERSP
jgi:hypothetical protein